MRLELAGSRGADVGAAVVRPAPNGLVVLEFGPADGPPIVRLTLSDAEALRLSATVAAVINGGDEQILIVDD